MRRRLAHGAESVEARQRSGRRFASVAVTSVTAGAFDMRANSDSISIVLKRVADLCYRHRWRTLIGWVVLLIGINVSPAASAASFSQTFHLPNTDSQKAFDLLDNKFPARVG